MPLPCESNVCWTSGPADDSRDLGRSFTADAHAVKALTYGAMLAHAVVRSARIQAALANEIPLEELRPRAALHVVRA